MCSPLQQSQQNGPPQAPFGPQTGKEPLFKTQHVYLMEITLPLNILLFVEIQ